ncbi:MAG: hypothetical protein Q7U16_09910 [Agitococcus sp.]|nr:hypothetical protein [Agitococcus sp.]
MLRDSINIALSNQTVGRSSDSVSAHFTSDREGYDITVKVIPMSVEINLELPYADSIGRELGRQTVCRFTVPTE